MGTVNREYSRGHVKNVVYNDRCGYAIIFYEPIFDLDTKIAPLRMADLPYTIPLQRRQNSVLRAAGAPIGPIEVKAPKVPGDYEAAKEFLERKKIERKMDEIRDACFNIRNCYKKAEKFDLKRREVISPRLQSKLRGKSSNEICDVLVDDVMQNVDYVYEKNLEEKGKTRQKLALAALRRAAKAPKPVPKIHIQKPCLCSVEEEKDAKLEAIEIESCNQICRCKAELRKAEQKFNAIPIAKTIVPLPPAKGQASYKSNYRKHQDTMMQRANDALLFEMTYGRMLRRLRNDIRTFRDTYS